MYGMAQNAYLYYKSLIQEISEYKNFKPNFQHTGGSPVCFLNGCRHGVMSDVRDKYIYYFGLSCLVFSVIYLFGILEKIRLTKDFQREERQSERRRVLATNKEDQILND